MLWEIISGKGFRRRVVRKKAIQTILLSGKELEKGELMNFCNEEMIVTGNQQRKIGF
jgi:hypothetical protein